MPVILNITITINDPAKDSYLIDLETTAYPNVVLEVGANLFDGQVISVVIKQGLTRLGTIGFGTSVLFSGTVPSLPATYGTFIRIQGTYIGGQLYV